MKKIELDEVQEFIESNIETFHENRLKALEKINLKKLLKTKNPYLFKAKNITTAQELITSFLDAKLSSSEEKIFGDFLEELALFVAKKTLNAVKSSSHGIDFEYSDNKTRYLVSVKSGPNWGNSSQWKALERDFKVAMTVLKQSTFVKNVECVAGICYGNVKISIRRGIIKHVCGQSFWYMITGDELFYTEIIKPLGHRVKELNDSFNTKKSHLINRFTKDFISDFCDERGQILWKDLVEFNSKNLVT